MFQCANTGVPNCAFLTIAAANMLNGFGGPDLRSGYLGAMLEGRWFGTMCLSEPQAGSSLGDIATKAIPLSDGAYSILGSKMWISGGEHEISENIVHFVLAKIPGGPEGTKGLSLFLVPKIRVNDDGNLGAHNNIALVGLNHKMGQRGTTNCLLNFGEGGESVGYLVCEENQGIGYMFHMMNEARIGVGYGATMQGRKARTGAQVAIIEHADVRRMLLAQKGAVEGAQALCLYAPRLSTRPAPRAKKPRPTGPSGFLGC